MNKILHLRNFIIILGISLALLVISEMILRIIFPGKVMRSNMFESAAYEFNEDYLISLKPNITKEFVRKEENGGYLIRWKTNSDSFRGLELEENPRYRVIVYGDSNIQARFSGRTRTFPCQLAHYLYQDGIRGVEVLNAGVVGFGPDQSLIRFTKEADIYEPDLVIFHVYVNNDFGDILRNRLFILDANGNLMSTGYKKTIDENLTASKRRKTKLFVSQLLTVRTLKKIIRPFIKTYSADETKSINLKIGAHSEHIKENALKEFQKMCNEEYLGYKESESMQFSHFRDHWDIDIVLNPVQDSSKIKIRLMEAVLKKANEVAHIKGIKFLVLIQPSVIDLTKDNAVLSYEYLQKYPNYKRTNLTDAVEKICVSHDINYINLFDVFMNNNPEDLFFRDGDDHWTDQGQKLAAKETALYIAHHSLIEKE